jgi:hypothetical protein
MLAIAVQVIPAIMTSTLMIAHAKFLPPEAPVYAYHLIVIVIILRIIRNQVTTYQADKNLHVYP